MTAPQQTLSLASEPSTLGRTEPRLHTEPLRELTPETSYGFEVIEFARAIGRPLDPWQEWAVIHGGELLPDGRPRFRKLLVLVARQNGKTELLVVLALYWLFIRQAGTVLGTSTKLEYATDSWSKAVKLAQKCEWLAELLPTRRPYGIYRANGQVRLETADGGEYRVAPATEDGGRSKTIDLAILDELRQHFDYSCWDAVLPAQSAVHFAQAWAITNAGGDRSIVLNDLRRTALAGTDQRLCLMEWSAPDGADPLDVEALAQANPNLGRRIDVDTVLAEAAAAVEIGGEKLAGFRTEIMCQRVKNLDPAINPTSWDACLDPGDLAAVRSRVHLCLDVSIDSQHATLVAAAVLPDGRVRVEPVQAWQGPTCTRDLARDLPRILARVRPQRLGWFPGGPAASLAGDLAKRTAVTSPTTVEEIRGQVTAVCMSFEQLVEGAAVAHSDDPLLNAHVAVAERLRQGDVWRFTRRGTGHVDAVYAAAGAVHLARTAPRATGRPRVIVV